MIDYPAERSSAPMPAKAAGDGEPITDSSAKAPLRPSQWEYDADGVPILSGPQIEVIATKLLEVLTPRVLARPCFTPIMEILELENSRTGLTCKFEELGSKGTAKILGKVAFPARTLHLDVCLVHERRQSFRFTAAHELGHWVLHRHRRIRVRTGLMPLNEFQDDERTIYRLANRPPGDWLERQANVFAAAVVMPRRTFKIAVIEAQKHVGISKNLGLIWLSDAPYSLRDFENLVSHLAQTYDVSKASIKVRLRKLGFLVNERRLGCQ